MLDACLEQDPESKVACETATKTNMVRAGSGRRRAAGRRRQPRSPAAVPCCGCLALSPPARMPRMRPTAATRRALAQVMVFGEITTRAKVDYEAVVRKTCRDIGFISDDVGLDADKCKVLVHLEEQSPDIGQGVHGMGTKTLEEIGAGDQVRQGRVDVGGRLPGSPAVQQSARQQCTAC